MTAVSRRLPPAGKPIACSAFPKDDQAVISGGPGTCFPDVAAGLAGGGSPDQGDVMSGTSADGLSPVSGTGLGGPASRQGSEEQPRAGRRADGGG
ncbi:MAG: hypothetical protein ACR2MP_09280 [Streptosporangiaceae bacterium]